MAKAWVTDRWVKDAIVELPDGSSTRVSPSRDQLRSIKSLPEQFRTSRWGKGARWRVAWYEATVDGPKERTKSFTVRSKAEEFAAGLEDDIRSGRYLDPKAGEQRVQDVAEEWLASKRVKQATLNRYREVLDAHIIPKWGAMRITQIDRRKIDAWVAELAAGEYPVRDRTKSRAPLKPSYIGYVVNVGLGSVLRYAVKQRIISANPLEHVELPKVDDVEVADEVVFSHAEIVDLSDAAYAQRGRREDAVLVAFLAYCGLRASEALALRCEDLDLDGLRVRVRRTWTRGAGGAWVPGPPKTWQKRTVPIPDFLAPILQQLVDARGRTDYVFAPVGESVTYTDFYRHVWEKIHAGLGLAKGVTPHNLRHTAASLAIASGADVKLVQRMLGHRNAEETLNTYAHLWPDRMDEVMRALSQHRVKAFDGEPPVLQAEAA